MTTTADTPEDCTRYLSTDGRLARALPEFALDPAALIALYRAMVLTRTFDARAIAMQRTGKLGTFASSLGQEAIGVGVAAAMLPEDVLLPYYRDHGAQLVRGVTMAEILLYWDGDERGSNYAGPRRDFPLCVPIGTQAAHALGVACAMKLKREARVAVCLLGDGATSKGDFYESMNIAGVWQAPLLFVVNNNQWAISVPRSRQTAARTLAHKAEAAGIKGMQVDGNDVIAVRAAVGEALQSLRAGGAPLLIEALTYRLGDHTTADDATRYRDADEVSRQWQFEPIARLRNHLLREGAWSEAREAQLLREYAAQIDKAVEAFAAIPPPSTDAMFDHLYATLPAALTEQRETARRFASVQGKRRG